MTQALVNCCWQLQWLLYLVKHRIQDSSCDADHSFPDSYVGRVGRVESPCTAMYHEKVISKLLQVPIKFTSRSERKCFTGPLTARNLLKASRGVHGFYDLIMDGPDAYTNKKDSPPLTFSMASAGSTWHHLTPTIAIFRRLDSTLCKVPTLILCLLMKAMC